MNEVIELTQNLLSIPYIEENSPVFDGSFCLSPYMADGLIGDGNVVSMSTKAYIELFYESKTDCVEAALSLWREISSTKGMAAEAPDYTYEENAKLWRASLPIETIYKEEI